MKGIMGLTIMNILLLIFKPQNHKTPLPLSANEKPSSRKRSAREIAQLYEQLKRKWLNQCAPSCLLKGSPSQIKSTGQIW